MHEPSETERPADLGARLSLLTRRERQVLSLAAKGHTTRQIAARLGLSQKTIDVHRGHIMMKMRARRMAEVIRLALLHELS